jgi:hypothetical protein
MRRAAIFPAAFALAFVISTFNCSAKQRSLVTVYDRPHDLLGPHPGIGGGVNHFHPRASEAAPRTWTIQCNAFQAVALSNGVTTGGVNGFSIRGARVSEVALRVMPIDTHKPAIRVEGPTWTCTCPAVVTVSEIKIIPSRFDAANREIAPHSYKLMSSDERFERLVAQRPQYNNLGWCLSRFTHERLPSPELRIVEISDRSQLESSRSVVITRDAGNAIVDSVQAISSGSTSEYGDILCGCFNCMQGRRENNAASAMEPANIPTPTTDSQERSPLAVEEVHTIDSGWLPENLIPTSKPDVEPAPEQPTLQ